MQGKRHSDETRRKISENTRKAMTAEVRGKISKIQIGKKLSKSHRENISKGLKGRVFSQETIEKIRKSQEGEKGHNWKGDNVGYRGVHGWIKKHRGFPEMCEHCGKDGLSGHSIHWANISGEYKRELNDWIRLCVSCHMKFDNVHKKAWDTRGRREK